jgi:hypothetical protein
MPDSARPRNPFFPLTIVFGGMFVVTILALVACLFGDSRAPVAQLLDRHAGWLLGFEVVATLVTGFVALAVDRRQTSADHEASSGERQSEVSLEKTSENPRRSGKVKLN